MITHGGFIIEFMNVVRNLQEGTDVAPIKKECPKNTAITVIKFEF